MILAAILLSATGPAAAAPLAAVPDDEIVVMARKLKTWRGSWGSKKGVFSCSTKRSTGDAEIDAIGCAAIDHCVRPRVPEFQAIADAKLPKAERNRRMNALSQSLLPCMDARHQSGIEALADRRAVS
ncbi:hypothetical protein [Tsuneonella amylolytica]|uniref:hypothetical protein n=1 Tax=Tsuneonella amylolytica TaxID=2338327 RepID=UPI000EA8B632|nr:hypothetical protein [Tsuneonella amylolytica]